jgi:very-short-patch-repair endonuclease
MDPLLDALVTNGGGLVTRRAALRVVPSWALEGACRTGDLARLLPGVFCRPALAADSSVRRRAALAYADGRGVLSHPTALAVWGLHRPAAAEPIHLTVPARVRLRSRPGLVVHATTLDPPTVVRSGQPVTRLERSLVDAWPCLPAAARSGPVIQAVNDRMTTVARLSAQLIEAPHLPGRADLRALLDKLRAGCRSALEIWGFDHVFTGPGMPAFDRQVRVRVAGRTYYLDVYAPVERVAFELDGASAHGSPAQREIDTRRDAALATLGILVVRFTHRRLHDEPAAVRAEILAILTARRRALP